MKKCMETDNKAKAEPLVSIVLATYNPRMDWIEEQLLSLNQQTYKNIKLIVIDDCSTKVEFSDIKECVAKYITNFQYDTYQNEKNLGSNKTFERLTELAEGEYIAYCDQDDVWCEDKIECLVKLIEQTGDTLVCSDVFIIDKDSNVIANSITKVRKRHVFRSGDKLATELLFRNFVIGCTMLMPCHIAKEAIPFIENMVHDHYLAMFAATKGSIGISSWNLVKYRLHGNNQTNVLSGVKTKKDYYEARILPYLRRMEQIKNRFEIPEAEEAYKWAEARVWYYHKIPRSGETIWKLRHLDRNMSMFELVMLKMPEWVFEKAVNFIQRGII
jgi:glycosyltransferase involved in cell wall biosynthesis